jgi:hypothetical protein
VTALLLLVTCGLTLRALDLRAMTVLSGALSVAAVALLMRYMKTQIPLQKIGLLLLAEMECPLGLSLLALV